MKVPATERRGGGHQPFGGDVDDEEDLSLVRLQAHLLAVAILLRENLPPNKLEKKKRKSRAAIPRGEILRTLTVNSCSEVSGTDSAAPISPSLRLPVGGSAPESFVDFRRV